MIVVENDIARSDAQGKELRVIGTGVRGAAFLLANGLTVDLLEEVDPLPDVNDNENQAQPD